MKEAVSWERSLTQDRAKEEYLTSSLLLPCNLLPVPPTGQTYLEIQFPVIQSRARESWDLDLRANKQMASTLVDSKGKRKFPLPQPGLTRQFPCKFVLVYLIPSVWPHNLRTQPEDSVPIWNQCDRFCVGSYKSLLKPDSCYFLLWTWWWLQLWKEIKLRNKSTQHLNKCWGENN